MGGWRGSRHHGLVFDTGAMPASDIGNRSKFFTPHGRFYCATRRRLSASARCSASMLTAEIQRMYVQPPWRGRGAARLLLGRLLDDARAIVCDVVRLESMKSLASAHALYRSIGFVEVAPHDDNRMRHYQDGAALDAYLDCAVFMALCLC